MTRLAKKSIQLPKHVEIKISGQTVHVKGPKGQTSIEIMKEIEILVEGSNVDIRATDKLEHKPFLGLNRALLLNAIMGVATGFQKKLQLVGVGYKAAVKGNMVDLSLGFSHPNLVAVPDGISVSVEKNTLITISGIDKQLVGQFAAQIRSIRPPEPYKGKGVRYENEIVRKKAGKTAK